MKFTVKWEVDYDSKDLKLYCDIDEDEDNEDDDNVELMASEQTLSSGQGAQPYMFEPEATEEDLVMTCEVEEESSPPSSPPSQDDRLQNNNW